ncbi:acyltransferase family protein [Brachybacterium sp. AOP43-C2-M15]|uniref:acyltransferase family protein n=1 Tax=Brachybacterium sp. AOP43-C2-M15 TaxID=3457661 RepID=UPI00403457F8
MSTTVLTDQTRMTWMDAVRGTAILLLLLWHASAVPVLFGVEMPEIVRSANAFFLPFRMPTLMLLSGMLLGRSLRKPLPRYLVGKIAMVLWPYLIWVVIAKLTFLDMAGLPWWHWRAWYATSYLWFLFFIGIYYIAAPLLRRLPAWVPIVIAIAGGLLLEPGSMEQRMAYFAIFFFGGHWLARFPDLVQRLSRPRWTVLLALPAIAFGAASVARPDALQYLIWGAPLSIAGALALVGTYSAALPEGFARRGLEALGRSSIVFYVSHFPVMALISQSALSTWGALVLAAVNLVAALAVGSLLARWKSVPPARWLFQAPDALAAGVTTAMTWMLRPARASTRVPAAASTAGPDRVDQP